MPTVSILFKGKILANYQISKGDTLLIGRNKINDIVIDNLAVSSQHAKIESDGNGFLYVDLQSENGSFVKNQLITSYWLNDGDTISIGKHTLQFSNPKTNKLIEKHSSVINKTMKLDTKRYRELIEKHKKKADFDSQSIKEQDNEHNRPVGRLAFLSENKEDLALNTKLVRIGKSPQSDISIKGFAIGKTSAVINRLPDGWYIKYVGGISKPRINNRIIRKSVKLKNLDIISIGSTQFQFFMS